MYEYKANKSFMLILLSVVFVSVIFNLFVKKEYDFSYLVIGSEDMYSIILREKKDVLTYILLKRMKQLFVVLILIKAFGIQRIYNSLIVVLSGISGLLISVQMYYLGFKGVTLLLIYILPHYLIYCVALYYCNKLKLFSVNNEDNIKNLIGVMVIFVAGMVIEGVFMTNFLNFFYQHMVM